MASRSAPPPQPPDTAHGLSLGDAITVFMEDLAIRKVSPATMKAYRADLVAVSALLGAHDGGWPVAELVGPVLRSAFAVFAVDHAPASVSRARSTWKALFDVLVADGHLAGNPMAAVPRPRLAARAPKPLLGWDKDTVERLVAFVMGDGRPGRVVWPELDRVIVGLLLGTGLRSGELLRLNLGSYQTAQGDAMVRVIGKGAKPRTVPVPEPLPALVGAYLASRRQRFGEWRELGSQALLVAPPRATTPLVTRRAGGRRLTASQLDHLLRQVLAAAGLGATKPAGANAHAYRHTYGTLLAAEGTPVADLQGLMGHASLATTQGYLDSVAGTAKPQQRPTPPCATFGPPAPSLDPTSWAGRQPETYAVPMTARLRVPTYLQVSTDVGGPERVAWLAALPNRVEELTACWGLDLGEPFDPGGNCSWVTPGIDRDGREVVLKVAWQHTEALHEAEGLAALGGQGAVEVYAFEHLAPARPGGGPPGDTDTTAMLLERCRPGSGPAGRAFDGPSGTTAQIQGAGPVAVRCGRAWSAREGVGRRIGGVAGSARPGCSPGCRQGWWDSPPRRAGLLPAQRMEGLLRPVAGLRLDTVWEAAFVLSAVAARSAGHVVTPSMIP